MRMRQFYYVLIAIIFCMPMFASLTQVTIKNKTVGSYIKAKVDSTNHWTSSIIKNRQETISTSAEHDTLKIYLLDFHMHWSCKWVYSFGSATDNIINPQQHVVTVTGHNTFDSQPSGYKNCK